MPQGYRPSREALRKMISENRDIGHLVRVKCCTVRYYYPADLITLFGDFPALHIDRYIRRCEVCGSGDWLNVSYELPSAQERQRIRVRRLVKIKLKRIPVWREE